MARILVTAGPTREHLDAVRYLANGSSGRMGYALAEAAAKQGHSVDLVHGPVELPVPEDTDSFPVISARQMQEVVQSLQDRADLVIAAAAVADYRPAQPAHSGKPAKSADRLTLELVANPDILAGLGEFKRQQRPELVLVGFALEDAAGAEQRAQGKLQRKNLDLIVLNHLGAMGSTDNEAWLLFGDGRPTQHLPRMPKAEMAAQILTAALSLVAGRGARP